ncbi:hypothetical protein RM863_39385, partial [Streptomyces sp. DSM 41014]|nr:hypothetical protein [Streptomyces sp. DSM 41014]
ILVAERDTDVYQRARRTTRLTLAAEMQWQLLPARACTAAEFAIGAQLEPAYSIHGDNFDWAADADELCSWGLKSLVKGHPNDFGSTRYDSLKDARRARQEIQDREDGKEAAQLYGRIDTLDGKERDHLLHLVERGMNSPAFSAELLTHLDYRGSADQEALLR